jgi:hypothetical protein
MGNDELGFATATWTLLVGHLGRDGWWQPLPNLLGGCCHPKIPEG